MLTTSLTTLTNEHLAAARKAASGRSAHTVHGGRRNSLRQTLLALAAGRGLDEHESPGEATLQVLHGRVRLSTRQDSWEGTAGDQVAIPAERHSLTALDDSAVLLTVVMRPDPAPGEDARPPAG
ncbi:cupin domain-containing protein [Streptosporangium sp. NPDC049248]|uniref:cupin domain-containing protein n=1 Tax=Streptosporangium sp. NPDC049248 TaxID=3155651 RepID=UPI003422D8CA